MRYERKIFLALLVAVGAFLPLVCVSLFAIHRLIVDENAIIENNARQTLLIERLQFFNAAQSRQLLLYMFTKDTAQRDLFYEFHRLFHSVFEEVVKLEVDPADQALLQKLKQDSDNVYPYRVRGIEMIESGKASEEVARYFQATSAQLSQGITDIGRQLAISAAESESAARHRMDTTIRKLEAAIMILAVLATVLLTWATTLIVKVARQKLIADERIFQISEARKEIVEIVAHDIKSPIATIQMTVDLMKDDLRDTEAIGNSIDMIDRSAKAVHRLITDLLDHTKIESGNLVLDAKPYDLGQLVEDVATRFKTLAQAKQVLLNIDVPDGEMIASCDSGRIDQAISNLIGNAIKFTPAGGNVSVACRKSESGVKIVVQDSGPGLSKEEIPHIFDRYWQVRKSEKQGTGLGLAIVKSIVDAHRGQMQVESQLAKGTKFFVELPIV